MTGAKQSGLGFFGFARFYRTLDVAWAALLNGLRRAHVYFWAGSLAMPQGGEENPFAAVILKVDRIGDFVLALSAIRLILDNFGPENCAIVISCGVEELARREFPHSTIVVVPPFVRHKHAWRHWRRVRRKLSSLKCDKLVCLRHQRWDYDELMLSWIPANSIHLVDDPKTNFWVKGRRSIELIGGGSVPLPMTGGTCRELQSHRHVLSITFGVAIDETDVVPKFATFSSQCSQPLGIVAPFSSASIKDLPFSTLAELCRSWPESHEEKLLFVGSFDQESRLRMLIQRLSVVSAGLNMQFTTLAQLSGLVELIGTARWVLAADTAAAHIAVALDKPTVVMLGGGHPGQFGPWSRSSRQRWLVHPLPCFNCGWSCSFAEPYCLTRIPTLEVLKALNEVQSYDVGEGLCN